MGRRNRRREPEVPPLGQGTARLETHPDGDWLVRNLTGTPASSGAAPAGAKQYRCPGCEQVLPAGTSHVVAWPADRPDGPAERRHWHTACWQARDRRTPVTRRRKR